MARRLGEDDEYGLEDDEDEHGSLIELSSRRTGSSGRRGSTSSAATGGGGSSATCRWITILFALALAGVYHLGLQEGKNEVKRTSDVEDVESKEPWHHQIFEGLKGAGGGTKNTEAGSFTREHIKNTREQANLIISMLEEYYFSKEQAINMLQNPWLEAWNFDQEETATADGTVNEQGNTNAYNRVAKMADTFARALVTDDQTTFLMGGIGSSVMAGHDNCHYDSYQTQMERLWAPVWQAADMEFVFQNAGEGGGCGDSYKNQHYCVKQNISPDVDIIHYSWTYFEGGQAQSEHEDLIRWAQMLPKQPPLHVFNTGTLPAPSSEYVELAAYYAQFGYNSFYMKSGFYFGGYDYDSETKAENPIDRFGWGYSGDGYHDTTRYGELEEDVARKTSLGVVMRNWHPGPMGFQLTSDAFTYVYTKALLIALDLIEKDMNDGNDPRDTWSASERPLLLKTDLPEPRYCDPEYCVVDEVPGCLNFELPTFGNWGARIEDPNDQLNPYAGEAQNWEVWHQNNDLWYMVGKQDTAVFKDREDKEICRHLDACGGVSAQKAEDGMVVFRLPKMEVGLVILCGCCGKQVGEELFMNNPLIEISYNTVPIDRSEWDVFPDAKCVRVLKRFPTSGRAAETPTGHAYLAVKILSNNPKPVRISHVITL